MRAVYLLQQQSPPLAVIMRPLSIVSMLALQAHLPNNVMAQCSGNLRNNDIIIFPGTDCTRGEGYAVARSQGNCVPLRLDACSGFAATNQVCTLYGAPDCSGADLATVDSSGNDNFCGEGGPVAVESVICQTTSS